MVKLDAGEVELKQPETSYQTGAPVSLKLPPAPVPAAPVFPDLLTWSAFAAKRTVEMIEADKNVSNWLMSKVTDLIRPEYDAYIQENWKAYHDERDRWLELNPSREKLYGWGNLEKR